MIESNFTYLITCNNCNFQVPDNNKFCSNCGQNLGGFKTRIHSMKKRLEHNVRAKVNQVKESLDRQITGYISRIDNDQELVVGSVKIPEHRKVGIRNALINFQTKLGHDNYTDEEFSVWMEELYSRVDEEKCIVCFQKWVDSTTKVVVCRYCQSGGHQDHLADWVKQNKYCPLCRHSLRENDLISVDIK